MWVYNRSVMRPRCAYKSGPLASAIRTAVLVGAAALCVLSIPMLLAKSQDNPARSAAQTPESTNAAVPGYVPTMIFDVASVRQADVNPLRITMSGGFKPLNSGNLTLENFSFQNLFSLAFPATDHKVDGFQNLPKELQQFATRFVVEAKADAATDDKLAKLPVEQVRLEQAHMIQVLLAERFNLKVHWETRDSSTYDLVVTNPKRLQTTGAPPTAEEVKAFGDNGVPPLYQTRCGGSGCEYVAHGATPADIADMLQLQFGAPITDKSGLTGTYYFDLHYFRLRSNDEVSEVPWPPLETAIQDQLGLKLVPSHGPVHFLVIDHAEMPSAN